MSGERAHEALPHKRKQSCPLGPVCKGNVGGPAATSCVAIASAPLRDAEPLASIIAGGGAVGSEEKTQGATERKTSKIRIRGGVDLAHLSGGGARARGPCKLGDHSAVARVYGACCTTSCARRGRRCWEHVLRWQWNPTVGCVVCAALQILKEPLEVRCGVDGRKAVAAGGANPLEILVANDLHSAQDPSRIGLICVTSCAQALMTVNDERKSVLDAHCQVLKGLHERMDCRRLFLEKGLHKNSIALQRDSHLV